MPRLCLRICLAAALLLSFLVPVTTHGRAANHILISEILYDPDSPEPGSEWVELYNATGDTINLTGWVLKDNSSGDSLPDAAIGPGQYLVVAANRAAFLSTYPAFSGTLISLESPIGNGLSNSDDRVLLVDPIGTVIDGASYGSDSSAFDPPCSDVAEGQSLSRKGVDSDTDTAADWTAAVPSPGNQSAPPTPPPTDTPVPTNTPTPTATHTPSVTPSFEPTVTATDGPTHTVEPTHSPTSTTIPTTIVWPKVLLSEILYDPLRSGTDSPDEWVEVFNPTPASISLDGWILRDNSAQDGIPAAVVGPGEYLVIAASRDEFLANFPTFSGKLISIEGTLGNGLSNTGDRIHLIAPDGSIVDSMSYGSDVSIFDPGCPDVDAGESLARTPSGRDTDTAEDWRPQAQPSPGEGSSVSTSTPTPTWTATSTRSTASPTATSTWTPTPTLTDSPAGTSTPSATPTPTKISTVTHTPPPTFTATHTPIVVWTPTPTPSTIVTPPNNWPQLLVSEVLYDSIQGGTDSDYEWVEVFNPTGDRVTLDGWGLGDNTSQDTLPQFTLEAGHYAVIAANAGAFMIGNPEFGGRIIGLEGNIGNGLSNSGDSVNLIAPDGRTIDAMSYGTNKDAFSPPCPDVNPGESLARNPGSPDTDSALDWIVQATPNPGAAATPVEATPTATATATATAAPTATPSVTTTSTPTRQSEGPWLVWINEVLPAPADIDWNGDGLSNADDEWVELHNSGNEVLQLGGWMIDDIAEGGSKPYAFPETAHLAAHGYLVIHRSESNVALNNDKDSLRLLAPGDRVVDVFAYTAPRPDRSYSRLAGGQWTADYPPSPGAPNLQTTPTPLPPEALQVRLNEILPDPEQVDWDRDGQARFLDEWIELYNDASSSVSLAGWSLLDDTGTYTLTPGLIIWPQSYLLLYRSQTGLALGDWRDSVTLLRSDGTVADQIGYEQGVGPDRSYCRYPNGTGAWTRDCEGTPGGANRLLPAPGASGRADGDNGINQRIATLPQSVAAARAALLDTRVVITGAVTLPPGLIARTIYIQDGSGGIKVYLRQGEYEELKLGDRVRVTGWTRNYRGESEISVPNPSYILHLGSGKPLAAAPVTSSGLMEENEGRFLQIVGAVIKFEPHALILRDKHGTIRVYFPQSLPWRRPYVHIGDTWAAQGVLGQYLGDEEVAGGYQIIPRFQTDVVNGPAFLPVTGGSGTP